MRKPPEPNATEFEKPSCNPARELRQAFTSRLRKPSTGTPHKTTLPNGVTVYSTDEDVAKLTAIIDKFAELWHDKGGAVDLPQEDWMRIPLRPGWESKITGKPKVYHLGIKDRAIVDRVFLVLMSAFILMRSRILGKFISFQGLVFCRMVLI